MTTPAIQLAPWKGTPNSVTPSVGTGSGQLIALLPVAEPVSVGAPPTLPSFVQGVETDLAGEVRRVRSISGHLKTTARTSGHRARFSVQWEGLTKAQRDAMWSWLNTTVGGGGTLRAFTIAIEGEGAGGSTNLRMLQPPSETHVRRKAGTAGVYTLGPVECEEVIS